MNQKDIFIYWIKTGILFTLLQYGLIKIHGIEILNLIDDAIVISLFAVVAILSFGAIPKYARFRTTRYDLLIVAFFAVSLISSALNTVPLANLMLGLKGYFLYFLLFYTIVWLKLSKDDIDGLIKFTLRIFVFQLGVVLLQLAYGLSSGTLNPDSLAGTFNGANYLGYAAFIALFYTLYMYYINSRREYLLYTAICAILLLMSSARFSILLFPIIFVALSPAQSLKRLTPTKIATIIIAVLLVLVVLTPAFIGGGTNITEFYKIGVLKEHFFEQESNIYSGSARNLWYPLTVENLERYSYHPLLGFGLGMYASNAAYKLMPETNLLIYNYFGQLEIGLDADIDSQIIPIWGETGYIGIIIVYLLLITILARMLILRSRSTDPYFRALASTTAGYTLFFMIGFYINHMLESQTTALLYFLFLGLTEVHNRNKTEVRT